MKKFPVGVPLQQACIQNHIVCDTCCLTRYYLKRNYYVFNLHIADAKKLDDMLFITYDTIHVWYNILAEILFGQWVWTIVEFGPIIFSKKIVESHQLIMETENWKEIVGSPVLWRPSPLVPLDLWIPSQMSSFLFSVLPCSSPPSSLLYPISGVFFISSLSTFLLFYFLLSLPCSHVLCLCFRRRRTQKLCSLMCVWEWSTFVSRPNRIAE